MRRGFRAPSSPLLLNLGLLLTAIYPLLLYNRFGNKLIGKKKKSLLGTHNGEMWVLPMGFQGENGEGAGAGRDAGFDTHPEQREKQSWSSDFAEPSLVTLNINFHYFILLLPPPPPLPVLPQRQLSPHKVQAARHSIQGMISNKSKKGEKMCQKLERCWAPNVLRTEK